MKGAGPLRALGRVLVAAAGATLVAAGLSPLEALLALGDARGEQSPELARVALADFALVAPLACIFGGMVGALIVFLEPSGPRLPWEIARAAGALPPARRALRAALAFLGPVAALAWCVVLAQIARRVFGRATAPVSGIDLGVRGLLFAAALAVFVLSIAPAFARGLLALPPRARAFSHPVFAGGLGKALAAAGLVSGIVLGDAGGDGPTPLAIFGVLKRAELVADLRPLGHLGALALGAYVAPMLFARRRLHPVGAVLAATLLALGFGAFGREAWALNEDPRVAYALQLRAPLGKLALGLARTATDRDGDHFSPLFGGGDCNDRDKAINPDALDIPGNGIDEDCSGADLPAPPVEVPPPPPPIGSSAAVDSAGDAGSEAASPPPFIDRDLNLILITIDTFRIDVGFMGYKLPVTPNLDKLAARGVVFDRAYSLASYTGKSIGPMLIGRYPSETVRDGAHFTSYAEGNVFLAERLKERGVHTMGCASFWYFQKKYGMAQGIDDWDMSAMPYAFQADTDTSVTSEELTNVAIKELEKNAGARFFQWVHYFDPHAQYMPHKGAPNFWTGSDRWGKYAYDGELWFTDKHVGRLLDYVESQEWGKDTVIIVTGDHGEAFGEHDLNWHGTDLWEPLVRTPLLVYVPGVTPHHVPVKRSHIDLTQTMLELMRVPRPPAEDVRGVSLVKDLESPEGPYEERDVYMDMPPGPVVLMRRAIIHGDTPGMKLIHRGGSYYALYDLKKDPDELNDVSSDKSKLRPVMDAFDGLRSRLKEIWVAPDAPDPAAKP